MTNDEIRELISQARKSSDSLRNAPWGIDRESFADGVDRLADALEGTLTEPEWEWALRAVGDGEPFSDVYESRENLADCENGIAWQPEELVRRRKAGPWLLVEGGSNGA